MMSLDEAIKHCEEVAETEEQKYKDWKGDYSHLKKIDSCLECANEHRQLAEWLKELRESRMVLDILTQFLADMGLDVCCEDLVMTDNYCEYYCGENQKPYCWYRWAKMKAREVNADE